MDAVIGFLSGLTIWHWVGLGIVLMSIEVMVGTFDLLWISIGAFLTALFALIVPPPAGGWEGQLTFFGIAALVFVASGRTIFKGLRTRASSHPNLNDRLANMIGQHGQATVAFEGGNGKVKIGDTVWLARADGAINPGDGVTVTGAEQGVLRVRAS
jgi:membrane protein implicated in regulation of membrane protease activity